MPKFTEYSGKFVCHQCKKEVNSARFYSKTYDLTWMCENRHLSKINLYTRGY